MVWCVIKRHQSRQQAVLVKDFSKFLMKCKIKERALQCLYDGVFLRPEYCNSFCISEMTECWKSSLCVPVLSSPESFCPFPDSPPPFYLFHYLFFWLGGTSHYCPSLTVSHVWWELSAMRCLFLFVCFMLRCTSRWPVVAMSCTRQAGPSNQRGDEN